MGGEWEGQGDGGGNEKAEEKTYRDNNDATLYMTCSWYDFIHDLLNI